MADFLRGKRTITSRAASAQADNVGATSVLYEASRSSMELILDLLEGTDHMRGCGIKYLPKEPLEEAKAYSQRLSTTFLFSMLKGAIEAAVSQPFRKRVQVTNADQLGGHIKGLEWDVDGKGTDVTQFANDAYEAMVSMGHAHLFCDFTAVPRSHDQPLLSRADEAKLGARPIWKLIRKPDMLSWSYTKIDGRKVLDSVKFREVRLEKRGNWVDEEREYIHFWTRNTFQIFRAKHAVPSTETILGTYLSTWVAPRDEAWSNDFEEITNGPQQHHFDAIPITTIYARKTDDFASVPPFLELAWTNVEHWQSKSQQSNILRFARFARLVVTGTNTKKERDDVLKSSVNSVMFLRDGDAKAYYVEHGGQAVEAGAKDLEAIEHRGKSQGAKPMMERTIDSTATQAAIEMALMSSDAEAWVQELKIGLYKLTELAAKWRNDKIPAGFEYEIASDYAAAITRSGDFTHISEARSRGDISHATYLREMVRRGLLSDTIEIEEEIDSVKDEDPGFKPSVEDDDPELDPEEEE